MTARTTARVLRAARILAAAAVALATPACSGGGSGITDPADQQGTFSITVGGTAVAGHAAFVTIGGVTNIQLISNDQHYAIVLTRQAVPTPGTYAVGEVDGQQFWAQYTDATGASPDNRETLANAGSVTISSVSSTRIHGSFQFQAAHEDGSSPVTLSGTFDATALQ